MQANLLGQNGTVGSSARLNVFAQLQEPSKKDGIWIKTEETIVNENKTLPEISKYKFDNIEIRNTISKNQFKPIVPIPYIFYNYLTDGNFGTGVATKKAIYFFGGVSNYTKATKYNLITNEYINLNNIPYTFHNGSAVIVGDYIYLFGLELNNFYNVAYKYNILTDEYTPIKNIPVSFQNGSVVAIDNNIYIFSGTKAYKYDITTNEYVQLANIPYSFKGDAVAIGNSIYLFGSDNSSFNKNAYEYNLTADTYTKLADIPFRFKKYNSSAVATNTEEIYLFLANDLYRYNTTTNTYEILTEIPSNLHNKIAVLIDDLVYLFGVESSSNNTQYAYKYSLMNTKNKTILIKSVEIGIYNTKLSKNVNINIGQAKIYDNNELKDYPCYWRRWYKVEFNSLKLY